MHPYQYECFHKCTNRSQYVKYINSRALPGTSWTGSGPAPTHWWQLPCLIAGSCSSSACSPASATLSSTCWVPARYFNITLTCSGSSCRPPRWIMLRMIASRIGPASTVSLASPAHVCAGSTWLTVWLLSCRGRNRAPMIWYLLSTMIRLMRYRIIRLSQFYIGYVLLFGE